MKNRHLVTYVEDSTPKVGVLKTKKALRIFELDFNIKYDDASRDDYRIDLIVEDIVGEISNEGVVL